MFLVNSRLDLVIAALMKRYPFSRSYRVILPSSLAVIHSSTLVYSTRLPVSVYGTGRYSLALEGFLGGMIRDIISAAEALPYYQIRHPVRIYLHRI